MTDRLRSIYGSLGLPRIIIILFFFALLIAAGMLDLNVPSMFGDVLVRVGMNGILVLAMVPAVQSGIGLNFGLSIGIVAGLLGGILSIQLGLTGFTGFAFAIVAGVLLSLPLGALYGALLNRIKGSEMTVSTYVGFSAIALMNIFWLIIPFNSPNLIFAIGGGLRVTVDLTSFYKHILNDFLAFNIPIPTGGMITFPTGLYIFLALCCVIVWMFMKSKSGIAMSAAGANGKFALAAGINENKTRILGTTLSTALSAVGIIVYAQSYGFYQLYNAPLMMSFAAAAGVLIGGASVTRSKIFHVLIGTFLFQGLLVLGLPVASKLMPEGNLSEVMRIIVSNGIILYALTKSQGGK
jgi:simple sugar transport system permease protein